MPAVIEILKHKITMKKAFYYFLILIIILYSACSPEKKKQTQNTDDIVAQVPQNKISPELKIDQVTYESLFNTTWYYYLNSTDRNEYHFSSDTTFSFISVEMDDTCFGNFIIRNDTLILKQEGCAADKYFDEGSHHRSTPRIDITVLVDGKIKHLYFSSLRNDVWEKSKFKFAEDYLYSKE